MNGGLFGMTKFELDVTHKMDEALKEEAGYLAFNPTAVDLTIICIEYEKKPEEVVALFKKIRKSLLE